MSDFDINIVGKRILVHRKDEHISFDDLEELLERRTIETPIYEVFEVAQVGPELDYPIQVGDVVLVYNEQVKDPIAGVFYMFEQDEILLYGKRREVWSNEG